MGNPLEIERSENKPNRMRYMIDGWTPAQIAKAAIYANDSGFDVDFETTEDRGSAMILTGDGNFLLFAAKMVSVLDDSRVSKRKR